MSTHTVKVCFRRMLVRHGPSVELLMTGSQAHFEHEYDLFRKLQAAYQQHPFFLRPDSCTEEGAFYRMYHPYVTLAMVRKQLVEQVKPIYTKENVDVPDAAEVSDHSSDPEAEVPQRNVFQRLWSLVLDVARAMALLHEQRIVHRNLSVHTITFNEQPMDSTFSYGVTNTIQISDLTAAGMVDDTGIHPVIPPLFAGMVYGVARRIGSGEESDYTPVTTPHGTCSIADRWTAPEAKADPTQFSYASDMYSFGVLIADLFVHKREPETAAPYNHPYYTSLLDDCMHADPARRPSFDGEFIVRLEGIREYIDSQSSAWSVSLLQVELPVPDPAHTSQTCCLI